MQKLIQEGKVRYAGLSNHPVDLIARAMAVAPVASLQHQYSILAREVEDEILPYARQHRIGVLAWGTLAHGFLVDSFDVAELGEDDFRRRHTYAGDEVYPRLLQLRAGLQAIAQDNGKTVRDLAVAWTLMQPALRGAIIGVRTAREASGMLGGANWRLAAQDMSSIRDLLQELSL